MVCGGPGRIQGPGPGGVRAGLPHNAGGKVMKHLLGRPEAQSGFVPDEA